MWRSKYGGLTAADLARMKSLEAETMQMQRIIARQTVKIDAMEELTRKTRGAVPASQSREGPVVVRARRRSSREPAQHKGAG